MSRSPVTRLKGSPARLRRPVAAPRQQVAALPVRLGPEGCEVLLITSRETQRWIVPKGWPMKGRKDHAAAAREALEEAGIKGRIHKQPIGWYSYEKRLPGSVEPCRVTVYRLDVVSERSRWLECEQRTRQWFTLAEAAEQVAEPDLASLILALEQAEAA
jgi:8-oxo-dGTP pyrophosphatase MutT (NUDIX family)